ncbi:hypothetical protein FQN49_004846 [Arthroderma sp. PD_2]|nr:hypothetical protein FQN49_004846 [Arthroderma sp. PD_2]
MATLPLPPHRSLLHGVEQLPPYTPRLVSPGDPETASVHSNAPSYVSAAPSYHSYVPASHRRATDIVPPSTPSPTENQRPRTEQQQQQQRQERPARTQAEHDTNRHGLPPTPMYARGFENRIGPTSPFSNSSNFTPRSISSTTSSLRSLYNSSEWVPVTGGLQARHYRNVANRRVSSTGANSSVDAISRFIFPGLFQTAETDITTLGILEAENRPNSSRNASVPFPLGPAHNSSTLTLVHSPTEERPAPTPVPNEPSLPTHSGLHLPLSPHEDPDLVGEEAAARFRSQRLYMASQQGELNGTQSLAQSRNHHQQQEPPAQPGLVYQYSSLVSPASTSIEFTPSPEQQRRAAHLTGSPTSSDNSLLRPRTSTERIETTRSRSTEAQPSNTPAPAPTPAPAHSANPTFTPSARTGSGPSTATRYNRRSLVDRDDVLRAQEAQNWDFMLAQMADGEGRERTSWKRYKGQVEKQIHVAKHLKLGPLLVVGWRRRMEERRKAKARGLH